MKHKTKPQRTTEPLTASLNIRVPQSMISALKDIAVHKNKNYQPHTRDLIWDQVNRELAEIAKSKGFNSYAEYKASRVKKEIENRTKNTTTLPTNV